MVEAGLCDSCGDPLGAEAERWRRTIPDYLTAHFCADCSKRLADRASEWAASEEDETRIRGMTSTLAGEVWQSPTTLYWYRDPIVIRPKPTLTPVAAVAPVVAAAKAKSRKRPKATTSRKKPAPRPPRKRGTSSKNKAPARARRAKPKKRRR